jgi:hypothetical protein
MMGLGEVKMSYLDITYTKIGQWYIIQESNGGPNDKVYTLGCAKANKKMTLREFRKLLGHIYNRESDFMTGFIDVRPISEEERNRQLKHLRQEQEQAQRKLRNFDLEI